MTARIPRHPLPAPAARARALSIGLLSIGLLSLGLGLAGCGGESGVSREQAVALAAERDAALARVNQLEADATARETARLQRIEETDAAAREADRLLASLMSDIGRKDAQIERLNRRLAEAEAEDLADVIRLQDGKEIVCRVVDLQEGIAEVQLADGSRKKARLADVERILLRAVAAPDAAPVPAPVVGANPAPAAPGAGRTLALSPFWNIPLPASTRTTQALQTLLSPYGTPRLDLSGRDAATLFQEICYLMPADLARATLGENASQRADVTVPGLPKNSFFRYEFTGSFEGRFNRLLLVTDSADQVVAVQLVEDAPRERWLDPNVPPAYSSIYDSNLSLFNIIENRAKSMSKGLVGVRVSRLDEDVLRIDSEFLSSQLDSRECVRLYVAQPVVNLILHLIETRY